MPAKGSAPIVMGRRNCARCSRWRPLTDFTPVRRKRIKTGRYVEYPHAKCASCRREEEKERYHGDSAYKEKVRKRQSEYHKSPRAKRAKKKRESDPGYKQRDLARRRAHYRANPQINERNRARHQDRMLTDPEYARAFRVRQRNYARRSRERQRAIDFALSRGLTITLDQAISLMNREKSKPENWRLKGSLTPDKLEALELVAPIPVEVMKPRVQALVDRSTSGGLSDLTGVPERTIYRILHDPISYSVSLDVADRLVLNEDYDLDDLLDAAREWAHQTEDPWPIGYRGVTKYLRRIESEGIEAVYGLTTTG